MIKVFYLVITLIGSNGVTAVQIPQSSIHECQANAARFNGKKNIELSNTIISGRAKTQGAFCVSGVLR